MDIDDYKRRMWRLLLSLERRLSRDMRRLLRSEYMKAGRAVGSAQSSDVEAAIAAAVAAHEATTLTALQQSYQRTVRPAASVSLIALGKYRDDFPISHEPLFERLTRQWTETHGLNAARSIADTTRDDVRRVIAKLQADGATIPEISKGIIGLGGIRTKVRADTIAITETHNAAMYATDGAARSTGLRMVKEWLSAEDARVRPTHAAANGQVREMDEPFMVGGVAMQRPGDPAAPASETIRCRCTVAYREKRYEIE